MSIEDYKMANGYYSTARIRTDSGAMDDTSAFFLDIFGSFDDDGKDDGGALPGEWQALLQIIAQRDCTPIRQESTDEKERCRAGGWRIASAGSAGTGSRRAPRPR